MPGTERAPIRHPAAIAAAARLLCHVFMTEITRWQNPAARRGVHRFVPGLPEPIRAGSASTASTPAGDAMGRALEDWMQHLTVASTVDGD